MHIYFFALSSLSHQQNNTYLHLYIDDLLKKLKLTLPLCFVCVIFELVDIPWNPQPSVSVIKKANRYIMHTSTEDRIRQNT